MEKIIDLNQSVRELCIKYPEVIEIMKIIGFESITNPVMLNTAGRFMTLKKGAEMKKISLDNIKAEFIKNGFNIID